MLGAVYPHAEYAEDQLHSKEILALHVVYRGFQTGAVLGAAVGGVRSLLLRRKAVAPALARAAALRSIGMGGAFGLVFGIASTPIRMFGREEIEWQDRSWRLLANKYQEEVDDWTVPGTLLGATAAAVRGARPLTWRSVMGGAGVGSLTALGALMVWRVAVRKEPQENVKPSGPISVSAEKS